MNVDTFHTSGAGPLPKYHRAHWDYIPKTHAKYPTVADLNSPNFNPQDWIGAKRDTSQDEADKEYLKRLEGPDELRHKILCLLSTKETGWKGKVLSHIREMRKMNLQQEMKGNWGPGSVEGWMKQVEKEVNNGKREVKEKGYKGRSGVGEYGGREEIGGVGEWEGNHGEF